MAYAAAAAYAWAAVYLVIIRPLRKRKRKPVYVIKDGKLYPP